VPPVARYVLFNLANAGVDAAAIKEALSRLAPLVNGSGRGGGRRPVAGEGAGRRHPEPARVPGPVEHA